MLSIAWRERMVAGDWQERLGSRAVVLTRDEAIDAGLFGHVVEEAAERIGDLLLITTGDWRISSRNTDSIVSSLVGQHGSLTAAELEVPLLEYRR